MPEDDPVVLLSVKLLVILQVNQFDIGQFYLSIVLVTHRQQ